MKFLSFIRKVYEKVLANENGERGGAIVLLTSKKSTKLTWPLPPSPHIHSEVAELCVAENYIAVS